MKAIFAILSLFIVAVLLSGLGVNAQNDDDFTVEPPIVPKQAHKLGENECTWSPSHWCSTIELARKCNAVDFCKQRYGLKED